MEAAPKEAEGQGRSGLQAEEEDQEEGQEEGQEAA